MHESTDAVRADIEATRTRMSSTMAELEKKVDVTQKIRDNPWPALAIAFGVGLALSGTGAAGAAANVAGSATSKVGSAIDDMLATTVAGLAAAFQGKIDEAVHGIVKSIGGSDSPKQAVTQLPSRAD